MKWMMASFRHETNTFSPVPTPYSRFFTGLDAPLSGDVAIAARRGTGTSLGAFIEVAERAGISYSIPIIAEAMPSMVVDSDAYERIAQSIVRAAAEHQFDAILLDLHGAMVTEEFEDGEGELLSRLRKVQPTIPIGIVLDMHANLYPEIVENATFIAGYHTYPHLDQFDVGLRVANTILRILTDNLKPVASWGSKPMLPHVMSQGTQSGVNHDLQQRCTHLERTNQVLAASLFTGFPHTDISRAGLSVVVYTDQNDVPNGKKHCENLLNEAWNRRAEFLYISRPLQDAMRAAKESTNYPVILLDHCDNSASGGSMDTTEVLSAAIAYELKDVVFFAIYDPITVEHAEKAGVGNTVSVSLGGKAKLESTGEENHPIALTALVRSISDGRFRKAGPAQPGLEVRMGKTAVLEVESVKIVVVSNHVEPNDMNYFYSVGLDPLQAKYVILKSRVHWRAGLSRIASNVIECDSIGVTTSNYSKLHFKNLCRPVYPLDAM